MRRSDVYETRARELAVLAGYDAEARLAGPGGKMMPAWCTFRDAARAEHLAAEAAAVVLPPQAAAFQNAPQKCLVSTTKPRLRKCVTAWALAMLLPAWCVRMAIWATPSRSAA